MAKLTLDPLTNLTSSAITTINSNSDAIEAALELTLTRTGTSPNAMQSDLDMNSNFILNSPQPVEDTHVVRLIDLLDLLEGITVILQTDALIKTNNLSDLEDEETARDNLGLGTIAIQDAEDVMITGGHVLATTANSAADDSSATIANMQSVQAAISRSIDLTPAWVEAAEDLALIMGGVVTAGGVVVTVGGETVTLASNLDALAGQTLTSATHAWFNAYDYVGEKNIIPFLFDINGRAIVYWDNTSSRLVIYGVNKESEQQVISSVPEFSEMRRPSTLRPNMFEDIEATREDFNLNFAVTHVARASEVATLTVPGHTLQVGDDITVYGLANSSFESNLEDFGGDLLVAKLFPITATTATTISYDNFNDPPEAPKPDVATQADAGFVSLENKFANGAVMTQNGSGQYIIVAPPHSQGKILRLNVNTETVTFNTAGAALTNVMQFGAGCVLDDGRVIFPPISTDTEHVLIYDPVSDTATLEDFGLDLSGSQKWVSFIKGIDGKAYGIPRDAANVLVVTSDASSASLTDFGLTLTDLDKWFGGILHPNGQIICSPFVSTDFLIIDTSYPTGSSATAERTDLGIDLTLELGSGAGGTGQWGQPGLAWTGEIYFPCFDTNDFLIVDLPHRRGLRTNLGLYIEAGHGQYQSFVTLPSGHLLGIPLDADQFIVVDPWTRTLETTTFGEASYTLGHQWNSGVVDPFGNVWCIPLREGEFLKLSHFPVTFNSETLLSPYLNHG